MTLADDRSETIPRLAVSRETIERFDIYVDLLLRWQPVKNLVSPSTLDQIWTRHILDSAQLLPYIGGAKTVADFGSGAGFPGLVIAIAHTGDPGFHVHLVESNGRKASFLREVARATGAPAVIHAERIESFVETCTEKVDLVTARALAPLTDLLGFSAELLKTGSRALFLKGQDVVQELTEAHRYWNIDATLIPSVTDSSGKIVSINAASQRTEPA